MQRTCVLIGGVLLAAFLLAALPTLAAPSKKTPPTIEQLYPGLSGGLLRQARSATLSKGTVLKAGKVTVTEKQLAEEMAKLPEDAQSHLKKNQFFLLEEIVGKALILAEGRAWARAEKRADELKDEDELIGAYLQHLAKGAKVTEAEVRAMFDSSKEMLGELAFEDVEKELTAYLLEMKQQQLIEAYILTLSERTSIEVQANWLKTHAEQALDNPADKARRGGTVALLDFGASGCGPCDMLEPIVKELRASYGDRCAIVYIDVREHPVLAMRYSIYDVPVLLFFDKDGKEAYRHSGFMPKDAILAKLAELGVK